jgi:sulfotransferase
MSGPVCGMVSGLLRSMGAANEYSQFLSDIRRQRIVASVFDGYGADCTDKELIFDTNREWSAHLPMLAKWFPQARVICCVRSPAWILDSVKRRVQGSPFLRGKMFSAETGDNVYSRAEHMLKKGLLAAPLQALRQAWYGEQAHRLIAIRCDSLTAQPAEVSGRLYELLGQPLFPHDFDNLEYDEPEFDARLGMPGFYRVGRASRRITAPPFCLPISSTKTTAAFGMFPAKIRAA